MQTPVLCKKKPGFGFLSGIIHKDNPRSPALSVQTGFQQGRPHLQHRRRADVCVLFVAIFHPRNFIFKSFN